MSYSHDGWWTGRVLITWLYFQLYSVSLSSVKQLRIPWECQAQKCSQIFKDTNETLQFQTRVSKIPKHRMQL